MIEGVKLVSIQVSEPGPALSFFCDALGFRVLTDQPHVRAGRWIELEIGRAGTRLALIATGRKVHPPRSPYISFTARDLRETCQTLVALGVEFTLPLTQRPWGSVAVFKDPDGNPLAVSSRR